MTDADKTELINRMIVKMADARPQDWMAGYTSPAEITRVAFARDLLACLEALGVAIPPFRPSE